MMKATWLACVLALALLACGEPEQRSDARTDSLDDLIAAIQPGMTRGQVEELLAPILDTSVISSSAGTGSGYTSRRAVQGGRFVVLAYSLTPGGDGPSDRDVLMRRPVVEIGTTGGETR